VEKKSRKGIGKIINIIKKCQKLFLKKKIYCAKWYIKPLYLGQSSEIVLESENLRRWEADFFLFDTERVKVVLTFFSKFD